MPTNPIAPNPAPAAGAADPKQAAYDALNALLDTATAAANNPANTPAARDVAFTTRRALSAQLAALDQAQFTGNTVDLQAAEAEMKPGMTNLVALKAKISALGNDLKEAASILSGIDKVVGEFTALGL
jgi:cbb3-type cytochrome oxidase cytochrome c subunit